MKRYLTTLALVALLAVAGTVFAAPSSVDRITNRIEPLIKTDFIQSVYFVATSTTASSTFANGLNLTGGCFAVNNVCITAGGGGGSGVVNAGTQGQNAFYDSTGATVSGTSTIFISTASNVGIGTTSPEGKLHVIGDYPVGLFERNAGSSAAGAFATNLFRARANSNSISSGFGPSFLFSAETAGGTETMLGGIAGAYESATDGGLRFITYVGGSSFTMGGIGATGNVGFGTTNPINALVVQQSTSTSPLTFKIHNTQGSPSGDVRIFMGTSGTTNNETVGAAIIADRDDLSGGGGTALTFSNSVATTFSEKMRIASNGNVGIGTTTPGGLLHVGAGTTGVNDTNVIIDSGSGSGAEPQIRFLRNSVLKGAVYVNSLTENLVFYNGGDRLVMTPAGRIGIGTTTPSAFAQITNTSADPSFLVEDSASVDSSPFIIDASGNVGIGTTTPVGSGLTISSAATPQITFADQSLAAGNKNFLMRLNASIGTGVFQIGSAVDAGSASVIAINVNRSGFVGLGTSSPARQLDVWGNMSVTSSPNDSSLQMGGSSNIAFIQAANAANNATKNLILQTSGGNVGISTTSPANKLHVYRGAGGGSLGDATNDVLIIENSLSAAMNIISPTNASGGVFFSDNTRAVGRLNYDHSTDAMTFFTGGSQRAIITSVGNVGVGTTTPYAKLAVVGDVVAATVNATSTTATSTFQGNVLIGPTGRFPKGFTNGTNFVLNDTYVGPFQGVVVNDSTSNFAIASWFLGNDKYVPNEFFSTYYCGMAMASSNYNVPGFNGLKANGAAFFCKDGDITVGTGTSTGAIRLQAGGLDADQVDVVITGVNGNMGVGTTSPYAKLSIHPKATDTQTTLFAIASSTATATTTLFAIDNIGNLMFGTSTKLAKTNIAAQTGVAMIVDGGAAGVDIAQFNRGIGASASVAISGGGALPQVKFGNNGAYFNSMFYDANTGTFKISTTSTNTSTQAEPFTIRNSNSFVGISSTTPSGRLSIGGGYDTTSSYVNINPAGTGTNRYMTITGTAIDVTTSNTGSPNSLLLQTAAGNNGSVGIGTTSPSGRFAVNYTGTTDKREIFTLNGVGLVSRYDDNSSANMRLQNYSTTASSTYGSSIQFDLSAQAAGVVTQINAGYISMLRTQDWSNTSTTNTSALLFATRNGSGGVAERVRISPEGNLGIATTSPSEEFSIGGIGSATSTAYFGSGTGKGSCLVMADTDGSGVTYVTANNGVLSASTVPCN